MWEYSYIGRDNDYARFLMHHGILGQKWGVRRFQNKDGSLTPAGKERYGSKSDSSKPLTESLSERGYKKDSIMGYGKALPVKSDKLDLVEIYYDDGTGEYYKKHAIDEKKLNSILKDVESNPNKYIDQYSNSIVDYFFAEKDRLPWAYGGIPERAPQITTEQAKKEFRERIGMMPLYDDKGTFVKGFASFTVFPDGTGEFAIDDGGAFFGHFFIADVDFKDPNKPPRDVSVNG